MSHAVFTVYPCQIAKTDDNLVPRDVVEHGVVLADMEQTVRDRAAAMLHHARQKRDRERQEQETALQAQRQQAEASLEQWKADIKETIIQETLQWFVEAKDMERTITQTLRERIQTQCKDVISHWAADENPSPILLRHLTQLIEKQVDQQSLKLAVSHAHLNKMMVVFGERLQVVEDPTLEEYSAVLSSPLLSMQIDLKRHLAVLLKQLTEHSEGQDDGTD